MKRFMKTCAIIAAALCLLGLLLGVTASSLRGREAISEVVEKVTGGWVHVNMDDFWGWSVSVGRKMGAVVQQVTDQIETAENLELLPGGMTDFGYDVSEKSMFEHGYQLYKGDVKKYCPGEEVENLDVNVGGCTLETKASSDGKFYIEVKNASKFQGYVEGGTLYIKAADGAKSWNKAKSCHITLYVPRDFSFVSVEVAMGAGTLDFSELKAREDISLEVGAGQIVVKSIQSAGHLELEIGAGEIRLQDMEAGELAAEIGMGSFTAEGSVTGNVEIQCSMGNVELDLADSEESFDYVIQCAMGSINLGGGSYSGLAQEKRIQNGAARTMEIECSMGNVEVNFNN